MWLNATKYQDQQNSDIKAVTYQVFHSWFPATVLSMYMYIHSHCLYRYLHLDRAGSHMGLEMMLQKLIRQENSNGQFVFSTLM